MTWVSFSTERKEVRVRGIERSAFGVLFDHFLQMAERMTTWRGASSASSSSSSSVASLSSLASSSSSSSSLSDKMESDMTRGLNAGLALGNDTVRFMARVHGQCEIHGYVRPENKKWLAGIIKRGMEDGPVTAPCSGPLLRPDCGWLEVIALLLEDDISFVVMGYSVTGAFPSLDWLFSSAINPLWRASKPKPKPKSSKPKARKRKGARGGKSRRASKRASGTADRDIGDDDDSEEENDDDREQPAWAEALSWLVADESLELRPRNWTTFYYSRVAPQF